MPPSRAELRIPYTVRRVFVLKLFLIYITKIVSCRNCSKRILAQSLSLTCSICNNIYHLRCLYSIRREDSLYKERNTNNWICVFCAKSLFPFNNCSDDDEFIKIFSELSTSPKQVHLNVLDDMLFDPFQPNEFDTDVHLFDVDRPRPTIF